MKNSWAEIKSVIITSKLQACGLIFFSISYWSIIKWIPNLEFISENILYNTFYMLLNSLDSLAIAANRIDEFYIWHKVIYQNFIDIWNFNLTFSCSPYLFLTKRMLVLDFIKAGWVAKRISSLHRVGERGPRPRWGWHANSARVSPSIVIKAERERMEVLI